MSKTYSKTRILVECALMIAIGTVLSNIKIFTMPNGGSVTLLSMLLVRMKNSWLICALQQVDDII